MKLTNCLLKEDNLERDVIERGESIPAFWSLIEYSERLNVCPAHMGPKER